MAQDRAEPAAIVFNEGTVSADGFRIRYLESGKGDPLVMLHGAGGLRISRLHELLANQFRVIALELPGFGSSPVNDRSRSIHDLARTMSEAATKLGLDHYKLIGTSFGARIALWQAIDTPDQIDVLVLIAPAAIRPENWTPASGTPEQMARLMYAHPEKQPPEAAADPAIVAKQQVLVTRLRGANRDAEFEASLQSVKAPTLVVFGTRDGVIPPEMGRIYVERIPTCFHVMVYDAGHAIAAERPEALHGVVADFLERREAFIVSRDHTEINP